MTWVGWLDVSVQFEEDFAPFRGVLKVIVGFFLKKCLYRWISLRPFGGCRGRSGRRKSENFKIFQSKVGLIWVKLFDVSVKFERG